MGAGFSMLTQGPAYVKVTLKVVIHSSLSNQAGAGPSLGVGDRVSCVD